MKLPKLDQKGITHILALIAFIGIFAVIGGIVLLNSKAATLPCTAYTYASGINSHCVTDIQKMLNTAFKKVAPYSDAVRPAIRVDGVYGPQTAGRVKTFQKLYQSPISSSKLTQDGMVGPKTWAALCYTMSLGAGLYYQHTSWKSGIDAANNAGCSIKV